MKNENNTGSIHKKKKKQTNQRWKFATRVASRQHFPTQYLFCTIWSKIPYLVIPFKSHQLIFIHSSLILNHFFLAEPQFKREKKTVTKNSIQFSIQNSSIATVQFVDKKRVSVFILDNDGFSIWKSQKELRWFRPMPHHTNKHVLMIKHGDVLIKQPYLCGS